jgi:poly(3-hydroxybutyrate) depolymerase
VQILPTAMLGLTNHDIDATETIWTFFKSAPPR